MWDSWKEKIGWVLKREGSKGGERNELLGWWYFWVCVILVLCSVTGRCPRACSLLIAGDGTLLLMGLESNCCRARNWVNGTVLPSFLKGKLHVLYSYCTLKVVFTSALLFSHLRWPEMDCFPTQSKAPGLP